MQEVYPMGKLHRLGIVSEMRLWALVALSLVLSLAGFAQDDYRIFGVVKDQATFKKMEGVDITVLKDGKEFENFRTSASGKYELNLPLGSDYKLIYTKPGYISKNVVLETRAVPEEDREGGFETNLDMNLFEEIEGFDKKVTEQPIGRASFNPIKNAIEFDYEHTAKVQREIEAELARLANAAGDMEKKLKQFNDLVAAGDRDMLAKKYEGAVKNYGEALKLFPEDKPVQAKLAEAQALWDAEKNASKLEEEYQRLISEGQSNLDRKNYEAARAKFVEASDKKPQERLPKDKIKEIDDILKNLANRDAFNALVTDGDKKLSSKDYALAIEKYNEALKLFPNEQYPRDKIREAQALLDAMLASEQEKAEREKRYKDLITLADKNFTSANYQDSKRQYSEALGIKPGEKHPTDRIAEIDRILAELAAKEEADRLAAMDNAEKERLEKEYNEKIKRANELFDKEDYQNSRSVYVEASELKPLDKYPKSRIQRIDEILAEKDMAANNAKDEEARKKLEEERLAAERARMDKDRMAEEERLRKLEEERLQRERLAEDERRRKEEEERRRRSLNNTDTSTEDEVERYYREAKASEDAAKYNDIKSQKDREDAFAAQESDESTDRRKAKEEAIGNSKDHMEVIHREGEDLQFEKSRGKAEEIEYWESKDVERNENHGMKRLINNELAYERKAKLDAISQGDVHRNKHLADVEKKKAESEANQQKFDSRGKTLMADNEYEINREKEMVSGVQERGRLVLMDGQQATEDRKDQSVQFQNDVQRAAEERLVNKEEKKESEKEKMESFGAGKDQGTQENQKSIELKKESVSSFQESKSRESDLKRDAARFDRFSKDSGSQKDPDDYKLPEGAEDLQEGVNETSYELPGKTVIERTVKIGNKVDVYRKVVSKTGTYYFKNNKSTTEDTWIRETLNLKD